MNTCFTLGVECRHLPGTTTPVDGENVVIPPHWTATVIFGGVDRRGVIRMWSATPGIVSRGDSYEDARFVVNTALRHFPIDGADLHVSHREVYSRLGAGGAPLRDYHMWVPPKDVFFDGALEIPAEGRVVGAGIGLERREGKTYISPYYAVVVHEEFEDGKRVPIVVPARWFYPCDPKTEFVPEDPPLREFIPDLTATLHKRASIGARVDLTVMREPTPHYALGQIYEDTAMGNAFRAAGAEPTPPPEETFEAVRGHETAVVAEA